jgi:hypothetical protein
MKTFFCRRSRLAILSVVLSSTLLAPRGFASTDTAQGEKLNGGYYLLHQLADDESGLPILLDLKHAPRDIQDFTIKISKLGKETESDIEEFHDRDKAIRYDKNPLPEIEKETRSEISGAKAHRLLFGTHDKEFVQTLLVSQVEATGYAIGLSKVLAGDESDPARARTMQGLAEKWTKLRDEAYRLLNNY